MSLLKPNTKGNRTPYFAWVQGDGSDVVEDCRNLVRLCAEYSRNNKILQVVQPGGKLKSKNAIRMIELVGRYGLYNISFPDVPLNRFNSTGIFFMKNPYYASYWYFSFLEGDRDRFSCLKKVVTLLTLIHPRGIDSFEVKDNRVVANINGRQFYVLSSKKGWEHTHLPSFSIYTKEKGLIRFYLTNARVSFVGHAGSNPLKDGHMRLIYQGRGFGYSSKLQKTISNGTLSRNEIYLVPQQADLIALAEIEAYEQKYRYDDPAKGYGTRMFYSDEAECIPPIIFPTGANSVKVLTQVDGKTIALHSTPEDFITVPVERCYDVTSVLARVPRMLVINRERLEQLLSDETIVVA